MQAVALNQKHGTLATVTWEQPYPSAFDFKVYEIAAWYGDDFSERAYERTGAMDSMDVTGFLPDAQVIASGFQKWDGCNEWTFHETGLHHCDPLALAALITEACTLIREIGKEVLDDYFRETVCGEDQP